MKSTLYLLVLLITLGVGCKKQGSKSDTPPPGNTDSSVHKVSPYVALIQKNTNLIKSVTSDTTYSPYPGMQETDVQYINSDDKPETVFFMTIDLTNPKISLEVGTPYDKTAFSHQTVTGMINYKNNSTTSEQVIAAVNGDYWQIHSGQEVPLGQPLGIVYKNGAMIKDYPTQNEYYFLAILNNKTAYIGNAAEYKGVKKDIKEALGGRYLLIHGGYDFSAKLNKNVEPRTSVGLLSKDKVVFIVVDGRRGGYSVGISMQDLEKLFQAIGAKDAINLDGGGSTTFVVKDKDGYVVKNKPSGNAERAVDNSWMVMLKK